MFFGESERLIDPCVSTHVRDIINGLVERRCFVMIDEFDAELRVTAERDDARPDAGVAYDETFGEVFDERLLLGVMIFQTAR